MLLAPSSSLIAGWQLTKDDSSEFPPFPTNVTTIPNFTAKPPVPEAAQPLAHDQLAVWLLKKRSEESALLSSSIGQPIGAGTSLSQGPSDGQTSSMAEGQQAPFFPLTEEQYKELDKGEPLLEGFPTLSPATSEPVADGATKEGRETQATTESTKEVKFLGTFSDSNATQQESGAKTTERETVAANHNTSVHPAE